MFLVDKKNELVQTERIISRQASLARQAFLITSLHGSRSKTGKKAYAKNSAM